MFTSTTLSKTPAELPTGFRGLWLIPVLLSGCNTLFYYPDSEERALPKKFNLHYAELAIRTEDQIHLHAWSIQSKTANRGTIVHFHGNAQNMTAHIAFVHWLEAEGYDLLTFDYRGYGRSDGTPSRDGLVKDGKAILAHAAQHAKKPLFVFGQSLGGAVAVPAMAETPAFHARALILESTFASYRSLAREKLASSWVTWIFQWPFSFFVSDDWSPRDTIGRLAIPILFIYGSRDSIVPVSQGRALYEATARSSAEFWELSGGGHTAAFGSADSPYRKKLIEYLRRFE